MLRDCIVIGKNNNVTRETLLRENDLTLDYAINICKKSEMAVKQLHQMDPSEAIHYTKTKPKFSNSKHTSQQKSHVKNCKYCGDEHTAGNYKAYGKTYNKCNKKSPS